MLIGSLSEYIACCIHLLCVFPLEKPLFYILDSFSTKSRHIPLLSRFLDLTLTASRQIGRSIKEIFQALCLPDRFLTTPRSIEISGFSLDNNSIASQFVETLLHALFFTCFVSFYYLVIHSILLHYIHAFIWILCTPLIIFNHLYVSWVKFYNFLYPLLIMTKRGRKCDFFLRFYMLGGEIHVFVRGSFVSSC